MADRHQYQRLAMPVEPLGSPVETVTLDKWWQPASVPVFLPDRVDQFDRPFVIDPEQLAAVPPPEFSWWQPASVPLFDAPRREWLYPGEAVRPVLDVPPGARYVSIGARVSFATSVQIAPSFRTRIDAAPA